MKKPLDNMQDILSRSISGFHQYVLEKPVHLSYVSRNLCEMLNLCESELLDDRTDLYASFVHPADNRIYSEFIAALKSKQQTVTAEYRMVKKDGSVIYVKDTAVSEISQDGTLFGYSVLSDITDIKKENDNLQFLNETIPCGFIKYTCEKEPKVTYINSQMMNFLRIPSARAGEINYLEMYRNNIFLMIPIEDRRRFALYLNHVYNAGAPVAGEMAVQRCDGTRAYLFGWVTKCVNEHGVSEFQSVCMDVTERYQTKRASETKRYIKALKDVYDKIFEYDLSKNTVKCLYSNNSPVFKWLENVPMKIEEATEKCITSTVIKEERDRVKAFFADFQKKKLYRPEGKPPQIVYKAKSSSGEIKTYGGIFLKLNNDVSFYCCRCISDDAETAALRSENVSLKENMQQLVMQFTEGIAAFEVSDNHVKPLYASDNVCSFFGFTKDEWLPLMTQSTPIETFVERSKTAYEEFAGLLRTGEAEFTYYDFNIKANRRIKAICAPKSPVSSPRYILLFNVDDAGLRTGENTQDETNVFIRTFGYFDVFVGNKPIAFRNKKSKELFALLVDRRGGYVSSDEAISFLWEDEPVNSVTLSRYRKVALRLKNILAEYGISDVVDAVDGKRRIATERVRCDLYDYLSGKEEYSQLFKGSYLTNYSWGENALAELSGSAVY